MLSFFVNINAYLAGRKAPFFLFFILVMAAVVYVASGVRIEENLNAIIPEDQRITRIAEVFDKSQLSDQLIFMLSLEDSADIDPDRLMAGGEQLFALMEERPDLVGNIRFKLGTDAMLQIYDFIHENLPLFLDEEDYKEMGKMLDPEEIDRCIARGFRTLISPTGMATGKYILKDPLNFTPIALRKLNNLQLDDQFRVYNSAVFTGDLRHLMIFMDPAHPASNIKENLKLIQHVDGAIKEVSSPGGVNIEYYGGTAVAVANSVRVKKDIKLTLSIALLFFLFIFLVFFRNLRVILLMFLPVVIGSLISIAILSLIYGQVSAIGLGVGVIFMGITIDYSFHFFTHIRTGASVKETIRLVTMPILMSAVTTASAFLCLSVVKSEALNQIGVFAAFAVVFSALTVLVITPLLIRNGRGTSTRGRTPVSARIERMLGYPFDKNRILVLALILLTIVFAFTLKRVRFNGDISTLNYMSEKLAHSEAKLKSLSSIANSSVYLVSQASSLEEALEKTESGKELLESLKEQGLLSEISCVSDLMLSGEAQLRKIERWNTFWDSGRVESARDNLRRAGLENHFKADAFSPFYDMLDKKFTPIPLQDYDLLVELFLHNFISSEEGSWSVLTILMVDPDHKAELFKKLESRDEFVVFDSQFFINQFFEVLNEDFSRLVSVSMIVVFLILLIFFGRIEIALITFIPIVVSWVWTLGLMGLFRIEINIFNIIISTFIFGLGIDYAIFMMNGIIANYREGRQSLVPYKLSIFLSALTTIGAIGVLIFAQHPALRSIALVSIFGISTVVFISYTLLPLLFSFLVKSRGNPRLEPLTLFDFISSVVFFVLFLGSGLLGSLLLPLILLWPARKSRKKKLANYLIFITTRFIVSTSFPIRKKYIGRELADFSKPSVIIANHQSQLDLVFLLQLNPKIIVLVNKWVWNNPFYGFVIRFADYYPVYKGLDYNFEALKQKVADGYSILAFPESSRSPDGKIKRFHQGALGIADQLGIEIQPVLIHGAYEALPKTELFLKRGKLSMRFFPRILPEYIEHDGLKSYRLQAKALTAFYRKEYRFMQEEIGTPDYYRNNLIGRYLYKGPVLEWYMKVKLKMEGNYTFYHDLIPRSARVLDLGCGYGFLSLMLGLSSGDRSIRGIDYDREKIATASMAAGDLEQIRFSADDITSCELPESDVYMLNDVLHYLPEEKQLELLERCMDALQEGGILIIRDADADLKDRTRMTKFTEFQSTRIFSFNKTQFPLCYLPGNTIEKMAQRKNLSYRRVDQARLTSNITHIIST